MKLLNKPRTWIVVADGVRARFFVQEKPSAPIEQVMQEDLITPRARDGERFTDRPGRVHERVGQGRHAMEPPTSPKERAKQLLAQEVARRINRGLNEREFDRLVLVAPPQTLGEIRQHLDNRAKDAVLTELAKDITAFKEHEIRKHLAEIEALGDFPQR